MSLNSAGLLDVTGDIQGLSINADGDTASSDNAAIGYTSAEGLILTGEGSTNDVTIKNDSDADVIKIPPGTTNVTVVGTVTAPTINLGDEDMEHYDEGTWTPSLATEGGSVGFANREGVYVRIGEWVNATGWIQINSVSSPSGSITLSGFPFTMPDEDKNQGAFFVNVSGFSGLGTASVSGRQVKNATTALCGKSGDGGSIYDAAGDIGSSAQLRFAAGHSIV